MAITRTSLKEFTSLVSNLRFASKIQNAEINSVEDLKNKYKDPLFTGANKPTAYAADEEYTKLYKLGPIVDDLVDGVEAIEVEIKDLHEYIEGQLGRDADTSTLPPRVRAYNSAGQLISLIEEGAWVGPNSGLKGEPGARGLQGATGATGPQGPAGSNGSNGAKGATGPTGPTGPTGVTGSQGLKGEAGLDGAAGAQGATGPVGPQGPAGSNGAKGAQGAQGAPGATGPQGPQGKEGPVGPQGPAGSNGSNGAKGDPGATGQRGNVGATGPVGPVGPVGPAGSNGAKGAPGATGPQGPAGSNGAQGAQGAQGATGPVGPVGPQGPRGYVGLTGPQGPKGEPGEGAAGGSLTVVSLYDGREDEFESIESMIFDGGMAAQSSSGSVDIRPGHIDGATTTFQITDAEGQSHSFTYNRGLLMSYTIFGRDGEEQIWPER